MVAGRSLTAAELNATWGGLSTTLHSVMSQILEAKAVLDGYSTANLEAAPFSYSVADATDLKSAATDMAEIALVFQGNSPSVHTIPYDYRTFAKRLLGPGTY